jgi:phosphoheptose isomerase
VLDHVARLRDSLPLIEREAERIRGWGMELAQRLSEGARLITAGNGGSAAQAQHLAAELVGRYRMERSPLSVICLHAESSTLTAICNDYGAEEMFARQVRAHGRRGDLLLALSTSGESANVLAAVAAADDLGIETWALTGATPNALADACDDALSFGVAHTATVQELHLVTIHMLCEIVDRQLSGEDDPQVAAPAASPRFAAPGPGRPS